MNKPKAGSAVVFPVPSIPEAWTVFTTRPETLYGGTFVALAPEHPLVAKIAAKSPRRAEIDAFVSKVRGESRLVREAEAGEKEGLATGVDAANPGNGATFPIWPANLLPPPLSTGALQAVSPAPQR